jgi:predicted DNA-binding transcriptional regulator AlpA
MSPSLGKHIPAARLAFLFGVSTRTVQKWIKSGDFPQPVHIATGGRARAYFCEDEVIAYLARSREAKNAANA